MLNALFNNLSLHPQNRSWPLIEGVKEPQSTSEAVVVENVMPALDCHRYNSNLEEEMPATLYE